MGSSFSCSWLLLELLVLVCTEVSWLEDTNIGAIPEEDRLTQRQLLRMISTEHQCKARQVWHMLGVSSLEGSEVTCNFVPGTQITQQGVKEKCAAAESWF